MTQAHVVLVDDEEDLREPVAAFLAEHGLAISEANGGRALDRVLAGRPAQLVVLDVSMPEEDGFSIARRLRAGTKPVGIIMLTARTDLADRIAGLELGADDYMMKPFAPAELLARIRSVLRRVGEQPPAAQTPVAQPVAGPRSGPPAGEWAREFWIPTPRGQICVPIDTIEWIEAAKDYALLHTPDRAHMVRVTMASLERDLDPTTMVRVHRSAFVAPPAVRSISQTGRNVTLVLRSGATVRAGPGYAEGIKERLGR